MEKISCEVIKDLLPLFVDVVLSEDSCRLVETHIAHCSRCRECYENMKNSEFSYIEKKSHEEKEVIRKIRKKMNAKKLGLISITAVLVAVIAVSIFWGCVFNQSYMSYENTGLYVEDNKLYTNTPYYCYYGFDSPEEGTIFIYMTTTFYESHSKTQKEVVVDEFESDNNDNEDNIKQVYYVPHEYVKFLKNDSWEVADTEADYVAINQSKLEKLKKNSTLVWSSER